MSSFKLSFLIVHLISFLSYADAQSDLAARCHTCRDLVKNFRKGLLKTAKSNFGGGNTQWEEKSLGSYAFSETRLLEILEGVCPGDRGRECHHMLEANEETIENWWFKHYAKGVDTDLGTYLCVTRMKVCCPNGTFGMDCRACSGGHERPCKGNGRCTGDGTRSGSGDCVCNAGFTGELCDSCTDGFYEESKNDTHTVCRKCHSSCKLTCSDSGPSGCDDCRDGWEYVDDKGCIDVNECEDEMVCDETEYCVNNDGSYQCLSCSRACQKCSGPSNSNCIECAEKRYRDELGACKCTPQMPNSGTSWSKLPANRFPHKHVIIIVCHVSCKTSCTDNTSRTCDSCAEGWTFVADAGECQDVDECVSESSRCSMDEYCINTVGSYKCSTCHPSCISCDGAGNDHCVECKSGFSFSDQHQCLDVDECNANQSLCNKPHEKCVNLPGSFKCDCDKGFVASAEGCVVEPKESTRKSSASSKSPSSQSSQKVPTQKSSDTKTTKSTTTSIPVKKEKKTPRDKAKEKFLEQSKLMYVGSLTGFVIIGNILRNHVIFQSFVTLAVSSYLFWLVPQIDKAVVRSK